MHSKSRVGWLFFLWSLSNQDCFHFTATPSQFMASVGTQSRRKEVKKNPSPLLTVLKQMGQKISSVYRALARTSHLSPNLAAKEPEESSCKHQTRMTMDTVGCTNLYYREVTLVLLVDSRLKWKSHHM